MGLVGGWEEGGGLGATRLYLFCVFRTKRDRGMGFSWVMFLGGKGMWRCLAREKCRVGSWMVSVCFCCFDRLFSGGGGVKGPLQLGLVRLSSPLLSHSISRIPTTPTPHPGHPQHPRSLSPMGLTASRC